MNSSENRVYFVFDTDRNVTNIVGDSSNARAWVRMKENSGRVVVPHEAGEAAKLFGENPMLYKLATNEAWGSIGKSMGSLDSPTSRSSGATGDLFSEIPRDLPEKIAAQRLRLMADHPTLRNPSAQRELTEIVHAHQNQRPIDSALFRPTSAESYGWKASIVCASGSFEAAKTALISKHQNVRSENIEKISDEGKLAPDKAAREALLLQEIVEADIRQRDQEQLRSKLSLDKDELESGPSMR